MSWRVDLPRALRWLGLLRPATPGGRLRKMIRFGEVGSGLRGLSLE